MLEVSARPKFQRKLNLNMIRDRRESMAVTGWMGKADWMLVKTDLA